MRRADRLFQIIQILRRSSRPTTADAIAVELETSRRTVYRDVASLIGQRVPIRGEAGTGYVLDGGFDLPPLMLTADEVEAAVLGAQWVAARADPVLARAAHDLIAKITAAVPERMRILTEDPTARAPGGHHRAPDAIDMVMVRGAIHNGRKIRLSYKDVEGRATDRTVWPIMVGYWDTVRVIVAWCEMRGDFRSFRTDRVAGAAFLEERYPDRPRNLRAKFRKLQEQRHEIEGC